MYDSITNAVALAVEEAHNAGAKYNPLTHLTRATLFY